MSEATDRERTAAYWTAHKPRPSNWWSSRLAIAEVNRMACGRPLPRFAAGIAELIRSAAGGRRLGLGVSVGCGVGVKELWLLQAGLVDRIIGYDLAATRIEKAKARAMALGLADRAEFHVADAFARHDAPSFDLVYWNNALHHMPDVSGAVAWSRRVLRSGGVFALDDYVGPNRFQIADAGLAIANEARALLSDAALFAAGAPNRPLPRAITREWLARQIARDPSEATDAAVTLEAVARFFPEATVRPTGGLIYFIGLNGLFGTFDESRDEDRALLGSLLLLDRTLVADRPDRTLYACAVAALPS